MEVNSRKVVKKSSVKFIASLTLHSYPAHVTDPITDFPDHTTFRKKGAKLPCADKLAVFLSLTLCNKANFDLLQ